MVSPQVVLLGDFSKPLPFLIFGGMGLLGGVASWFLPETLGKPLPQTLQDSINLFKSPAR